MIPYHCVFRSAPSPAQTPLSATARTAFSALSTGAWGRSGMM